LYPARQLIRNVLPPAKRPRPLLASSVLRGTYQQFGKRGLIPWEYARQVGIDADRMGRRGIGVHSLRKTAITNAQQNGAPIQKVQRLAGHNEIRTTHLYFQPSAKDSEDAARHIQIR
jgi:integrase